MNLFWHQIKTGRCDPGITLTDRLSAMQEDSLQLFLMPLRFSLKHFSSQTN